MSLRALTAVLLAFTAGGLAGLLGAPEDFQWYAVVVGAAGVIGAGHILEP